MRNQFNGGVKIFGRNFKNRSGRDNFSQQERFDVPVGMAVLLDRTTMLDFIVLDLFAPCAVGVSSLNTCMYAED